MYVGNLINLLGFKTVVVVILKIVFCFLLTHIIIAKTLVSSIHYIGEFSNVQKYRNSFTFVTEEFKKKISVFKIFKNLPRFKSKRSRFRVEDSAARLIKFSLLRRSVVTFEEQVLCFPREGDVLRLGGKRSKQIGFGRVSGNRGLGVDVVEGLFLIFVRFSSCPGKEAATAAVLFQRVRDELEPSSIPENTQIPDYRRRAKIWDDLRFFVQTVWQNDLLSFGEKCISSSRGLTMIEMKTRV